MSLNRIYNKRIKGQGLLMLICIGIPLILLIASMGALSLGTNYLFLFFLLICFLMHFIMIIDMQRKNSKKIKEVISKAKANNGSFIDQQQYKPRYELN
ncbi:MAG: hypothetical protein ACXABI_04680 [Candidatus Hodarchaeales archaeon]|jgi:TM2 domain-containing membrane protein YozV